MSQISWKACSLASVSNSISDLNQTGGASDWWKACSVNHRLVEIASTSFRVWHFSQCLFLFSHLSSALRPVGEVSKGGRCFVSWPDWTAGGNITLPTAWLLTLETVPPTALKYHLMMSFLATRTDHAQLDTSQLTMRK